MALVVYYRYQIYVLEFSNILSSVAAKAITNGCLPLTKKLSLITINTVLHTYIAEIIYVSSF